MHWLLIGLLGGFAFVYLTRLFWTGPADERINRTPLVTAAIAVLVLALLLLVTTGRVHWLSAAFTGLIPFARRAAMLLRFAPVLRKLRDQLSGSDPNGQRGAGNRSVATPELSIAQARLMLEVSDQASAEEIIAAHRRLIARNHPDKGGSTYIAAQLNSAKDLLLNAQNA